MHEVPGVPSGTALQCEGPQIRGRVKLKIHSGEQGATGIQAAFFSGKHYLFPPRDTLLYTKVLHWPAGFWVIYPDSPLLRPP